MKKISDKLDKITTKLGKIDQSPLYNGIIRLAIVLTVPINTLWGMIIIMAIMLFWIGNGYIKDKENTEKNKKFKEQYPTLIGSTTKIINEDEKKRKV